MCAYPLQARYKGGLSAGRVQSVAVRVLVARELERLAFHVSEYWDVEAAVSPRERLVWFLVWFGSGFLPDPALRSRLNPG